VQVRAGVPYRMWLHIRRASREGRPIPGLLYVQFDGAVDKEGREIFRIGTKDAISVRGTTQNLWMWSGRDMAEAGVEPILYFKTSGEVTVRVTGGAGGAGFDQFLLSPARFLEKAPSAPVVPKPK
jgi:hypothetical protein